MLKQLARHQPQQGQGHWGAMLNAVQWKANALAKEVSSQRHYMTHQPAGATAVMGSSPGGSALEFDPRFLVFEFTYDILLRSAQINLVKQFLQVY